VADGRAEGADGAFDVAGAHRALRTLASEHAAVDARTGEVQGAPVWVVGGAGAVEGGSSETEIAADDDTSGADSVSRWCGRHRHWQPQGLPDWDEL
jgi:hypothetical protein